MQPARRLPEPSCPPSTEVAVRPQKRRRPSDHADVDGRRNRPKVFGRSRQEVKDELSVLVEASRHGVDLRSRHVRFSEVADLWLSRDIQGHVSEETLSNYTSLLHGRIAHAIGETAVSQRRAADVERMLLELQELGRSARYVRLARNLTERVLDYAVRRDIVDRNIAASVRAPAGPTAERYGLTVKQARRGRTADTRFGSSILVRRKRADPGKYMRAVRMATPVWDSR